MERVASDIALVTLEPASIVVSVVATSTVTSVEPASVDVSVVAGCTLPPTICTALVEAAMVPGSTVVPCKTVVYVIVTTSPRALAGMALPTPWAVNCTGRCKVAVFGFAASLLAYMFPSVPSLSV